MTSKTFLKHLQDTVISKSGFCILLILSMTLCIVVSATGSGKTKPDNSMNTLKRSDIIRIDTMKNFGELEEPAVNFYHDQHTEVLVKKVNDCQKCHQSEKNRLSTKFLRLSDTSKQDVMDIYHNNCIGCHENLNGKNGPVTCRECHTKKTEPISDRKPLEFDKSLHYRHTEALENNCSKCHHEYDKKTEKRVYIKGQEGSCGYCHKQKKEENRVSIRNASHNSCIPCHLSMKQSEEVTGPVDCGSCHDIKKQKLIEQKKNPPRLNRKQPDQVLIKTGNKAIDDVSKNRMNFVPFNHKAHEKANKDCKTCHHKSLSSCTLCHSLKGKKEGGGIALEQAMHAPDAEQSCIGCHNMKKQDKNCLGCHALIPSTKSAGDKTCTVCHKNNFDLNEKKLSKLLGDFGEAAVSDVPEKIMIKKLEDQYKAVDFPHGKIITALEKKENESQLATSFHLKKETLCRGCHHNQPVTKKPSACSTCHDASIKKKSDGKPGLMAAYHIQCMECHENMKIGNNSCTDCHEKK